MPIEANYVAFSIPNRFVIGYGMDYAEVYRSLADIRLFPGISRTLTMMPNSPETVISALNDATKILADFVATNFPHHGIDAKFGGTLADLRATIIRDGLEGNQQVAYAFALYEGKIEEASKLSVLRDQIQAEFRRNAQSQRNWGAEQRSKAFLQLAGFSEKLVIVGSGYLAVAISVITLLVSHACNSTFTRLSLLKLFLGVTTLELAIAAICQFGASKAAHVILVDAATLHDEQVSVEMAMAYGQPLDKPAERVSSFRSVANISTTNTVLYAQAASVCCLIVATIVFAVFVAANLGAVFGMR